jgi:glycerol-3-phosphate dehydrogenase (NAD(P)+)
VRIGCLSGPNLAKEILEGQPTATLIASKFDEVIAVGKNALSSPLFHVFGSHDLLGAELAGALKNVIALGSGLLKGYGLGKNIQAMLITRGLVEMIYFGRAMGSDVKAFLGTAGIGDLIATATSKKSRNYTFGFRLGSGERFAEVSATSDELAEGVRTLQITRHLANYYKLRVPITEMLYRIVFEDFPIQDAMDYLMTFPYNVDVDFL